MTDFNQVDKMLSMLFGIRSKEFIEHKSPDGKFIQIEESRLLASSIIFPFCTDKNFDKIFSSTKTNAEKTGMVLDNVVIKESNVHGKGVFAKKDIKKGQIVTLYPGDIAIYLPEGNNGDKTLSYNFFSDRMSSRAEEGKNYYLDMSRYSCSIDSKHIISGCPDFTDNPSYLGHMINDRFVCDHDKITPEIYFELSLKKTNSMFVPIADNIQVAVVARRDIKAGEEIFVSYGVQYWNIMRKKYPS